MAGELRLETLPRLVGAFDTAGDARDVHVDGDLAFVADGFGGLKILDISDPSAPTLLGSVATPDVARAVTVEGNLAYVAAAGSGVQIIEVRYPQQAFILGSVDTGDNTTDVAVAGDVAYATDSIHSTGGLRWAAAGQRETAH